MKMFKTLLAVVALLPVVAGAQSVANRHHEQDARIAQGVHSGQLTRHEARGLRSRESLIHAQARRDRFLHSGHLTRREHARLTREQNRASHAIYRQKHDAQHRP